MQPDLPSTLSPSQESAVSMYRCQWAAPCCKATFSDFLTTRALEALKAYPYTLLSSAKKAYYARLWQWTLWPLCGLE